jgi:futalosine hydrolase
MVEAELKPLFAAGEADACPRPSGVYDAWVVAATPAELAWAVAPAPEGQGSQALQGAGPFWCEGHYRGLRLALLCTGAGPVNAAMSLGAFGALCSAKILLNCGVAGAYPRSGLAVGQLAVASVEIDADTGVEPGPSEGSVLPLSIPLHDHDELPFGCFPVDETLTTALLKSASSVTEAKRGPFVTSATVTSSPERAERLAASYGGLCENMEGAALARVALELGVKFAAVRGISNIAGPRDLSGWNLAGAIRAAGEASRLFLSELARPGERAAP